ncbi:glycerate kinase [Neolewinella agarilytica]|uniref:glycerate kinase n=1 Tax=Neolewinella agarilytica TaxID=478744 RepID=UPI002357BF5F|nr:glycerate kinase [Neolewinella agarilytica]
MNILIAPDKFKGSLSAHEVCVAIAAGLRTNYPDADIRSAPLADGGDGTLAVLNQYLHLRPRLIQTCDPFGRALEAVYLENDDAAFIEVAAASGLVLLSPAERNPLLTSTFGTGVQLRDALVRGKKNISLLLGGSATNDLGLGIAEALDFTFFDGRGKQIRPTGKNLADIRRIKLPDYRPWEDTEITLLCDVDNLLCGPSGAARMYAAQKGADEAAIEQLERGAGHVASLIEAMTNQSVLDLPGAGAAGGIGAGLVGLLGAKMTPGFDLIAEQTQLDEKIKWADVVISGEGQLDEQSLRGKVVGGILNRCAQTGTDCYLFAGRSTLRAGALAGSVSVFEIMEIAPGVEAAMKDAREYLTKLSQKLVIH